MPHIDRTRLDYECARRGLTATELARLSGITEATLSHIRAGHPAMARSLTRIAEALAAAPVVEGMSLILSEPVRANSTFSAANAPCSG